MLVEVLVEFVGGDVGPHPGRLLGARLGAVGVIRGGQHGLGDLPHPPAVQRHRRVQQRQSGHQIGTLRSEVQGHRTPEGMSDDHHRAVGLGLDQTGQRGDVGVDAPGRGVGGAAVPDQIRGQHRHVRQITGQPVPPQTVPGESVDHQGLGRPGRPETVEVQSGHALMLPV